MNSITTASIQDVLRRLRDAGDEHWDLRCVIYHNIDELSWSNLDYEFSPTFYNSSFRPLANSKDAWNIAHFHDSEQDELRVYRKKRAAENESSKRAKRIHLIWRKLKILTDDAFWLASSLDISRIPGVEGLDPRQLYRSYSTWMWLVYHAAWSCPAGSILRAGKYYPTALITRIRLEKKQAAAVGHDLSKGTFAEYSKARKAIVERKRAMNKSERENEWFSTEKEVEGEAGHRLEMGEFMSVMPLDPFTASASLLELLALTPLDSSIDLITDVPNARLTDNLSRKEKRAFEIIEQEGPIIGKSLAKRIPAAESTLRKHIIPKLRPLGVANDGDGYYVAPHSAT